MTIIQTEVVNAQLVQPAPIEALLVQQPVHVLLAEPSHVQAVVRPPEIVQAKIASGQGPAGVSGGPVTKVAAVPINAYKAVTTDATGQLIYADSGTPNHGDQVLGVSTQAGLAGAMVIVQTMSNMTNPGWSWVPGRGVFLGLGGELTQDPGVGAFCLSLGYAITSTEIFIRLGRAIHHAYI